VLLIFSFQSRLIFHIGRQSAQRRRGLPNIGHRTLLKNFKYVSCTPRISQGNDFELILTVKMKTRHPVEGYFGSEFRAICNHREVMAA